MLTCINISLKTQSIVFLINSLVVLGFKRQQIRLEIHIDSELKDETLDNFDYKTKTFRALR